MTNTSTSYCGLTTGNNYSCNIGYTCSYVTCNIYEDFMDSIDKVKDKNVLMYHFSPDIKLASRYYRGYLSDEELQETQYKGRFWCIGGASALLYILVDNETLLVVDTKGNTEILGRESLPIALRGRHYYDEC